MLFLLALVLLLFHLELLLVVEVLLGAVLGDVRVLVVVLGAYLSGLVEPVVDAEPDLLPVLLDELTVFLVTTVEPLLPNDEPNVLLV